MEINRQHPIRLLERLYKGIRHTLIPLALFIYGEIRSSFGNQPVYVYYLATIIGILVCAVSFLIWHRNIYSVSNNSLVLSSGLMTTEKRTIPVLKISGLDVTQSWLHRLVGAHIVSIKTSGEDNEEVELVLGKKKLQYLRDVLNIKSEYSSLQQQKDVGTSRKELLHYSFLTGPTGVGFSVAATVTLFLMKWAQKYIDKEKTEEPSSSSVITASQVLYKEVSGMTLHNILVAIVSLATFGLFVLLLAQIITIVYTQISYYNWKVERKESNLVVTYGALNKRHAQLPIRKIQSVRVRRSYLFRRCGYASVLVDATGYTGVKRNKVLLPIVKESKLRDTLNIVLPEISLDMEAQIKCPPSLHWHTFFRRHYLILFLGIILSGVWNTFVLYLLIPATIYILLSLLYNVSKYKKSGWCISENRLISVTGLLRQTTTYIFRKSITSLDTRQSILDKKCGTHTLWVDINSPVNGREYKQMGLDKLSVSQIRDWYKNAK